MHDFINCNQAKSYTSVYDNLGASEIKYAYSNHKQSIKHEDDLLIFQSPTRKVDTKKTGFKNSETLNKTSYITSERYHKLNKKFSDKSVIRSTSTFFYDLDSLAKRHSYHCVTNILEEKPDNNIALNLNDTFKIFKSAAIVQECATQMTPKLTKDKNLNESKKKVRNTFPNDTLLSSEIFLRDNEVTYSSYKSPSEDKSVNERPQKFWSFAKYRTEYTNSVSEQKKLKKSDRGKRTEDPCPCQLFSYACPCTNTKSLTELAKNSKSLTVADEVTSTPQSFLNEPKCNKHRPKNAKEMTACENKRTNTLDTTDKKSIESMSNEQHTMNVSKKIVRKTSEVIANTLKVKTSRKPRQVLCPNCKEMIDVMSATEEEGNFRDKTSPLYRNKLPSSPTYTHQNSKDNSKIVESRDTCNHEPQCELVPVCQILPTDNVYVNQNVTNKPSILKPAPRVIRITKGCRHHPPCTVVPSCQRINVLNNNCEYIPPCLHRPRCVNLPLCAPISKSIYYDEPSNKAEEDVGTTDCLHVHNNRCLATHRNGLIENQINRVQNTCEFLSDCSPGFVLNSTLGCISPLPSPCHLSHSICKHCNSEKSCQFNFMDWKENIICPIKKSFNSNEDVIFIRDVGCQFRNKHESPQDSIIRCKASSDSFNMNVDKFCTNYHTLRYKDKFTIPLSKEDLSVSTGTLSSTEYKSLSHGKPHDQDCKQVPKTGFVPKSTNSPYVAYTDIYPTANFCFSANDNFKEKKNNISSDVSISISKKRRNAFLVKSRSSFLKGKYKNTLRKKKRSKISHQRSKENWSSNKLSEHE